MGLRILQLAGVRILLQDLERKQKRSQHAHGQSTSAADAQPLVPQTTRLRFGIAEQLTMSASGHSSTSLISLCFTHTTSSIVTHRMGFGIPGRHGATVQAHHTIPTSMHGAIGCGLDEDTRTKPQESTKQAITAWAAGSRAGHDNGFHLCTSMRGFTASIYICKV